MTLYETLIASPCSACRCMLLAGCGGIEDRDPEYLAIEPIEYPDVTVSTAPATGSLFVPRRSISLFTDTRAHEIGDIVSVVLTEATSAAKSADTELDKSSGIEITDPTVFGAPVTINGRYNLGTSLESASAFAGEASSNQSNRLSGAIAVQVSRVLPNGNLVVQGEKWIESTRGMSTSGCAASSARRTSVRPTPSPPLSSPTRGFPTRVPARCTRPIHRAG
jgi:flagellar L-ring protein precursor FlgH